MEPEELSSQGSPRVLIVSIISLVVVALTIVGIVSFARNRVREARDYAKSETLQKEEKKLDEVVTGRLGLSLKGTVTRFRAGQPVTLFVYADSKGQEITGYDAVLRFNTEQVRFENVKSVHEGLTIFETVGPAEDVEDETIQDLIVTGIQSLSEEEPFVFDNTALAEVTFTVLQSGPVTIDLVYEPGSERESNLMTTQSQDIVSSVMGITLNEE